MTWAVALSPLTWQSPAVEHSGGALGLVLANGLALLLPVELSFVVPLLASILAVTFTVFALGLSPSEWLVLGRHSMAAGAKAGQMASALRSMTVETTQRTVYREPHFGSDEPDQPEPDYDDYPVAPEEPAHVVVERRLPPAPPGKRERAARQPTLDLGVPETDGYALPPLTMLGLPPTQMVAHLNQDA